LGGKKKKISEKGSVLKVNEAWGKEISLAIHSASQSRRREAQSERVQKENLGFTLSTTERRREFKSQRRQHGRPRSKKEQTKLVGKEQQGWDGFKWGGIWSRPHQKRDLGRRFRTKRERTHSGAQQKTEKGNVRTNAGGFH